MADYNSNLIKPVQGLQNIAGLAPAERRRERGRRRQLPDERAEHEESVPDEQASPQEGIENSDDRNNSGIDYCA